MPIMAAAIMAAIMATIIAPIAVAITAAITASITRRRAMDMQCIMHITTDSTMDRPSLIPEQSPKLFAPPTLLLEKMQGPVKTWPPVLSIHRAPRQLSRGARMRPFQAFAKLTWMS